MASGDHTSSGPEWNLRDPSQLLATGFGVGSRRFGSLAESRCLLVVATNAGGLILIATGGSGGPPGLGFAGRGPSFGCNRRGLALTRLEPGDEFATLARVRPQGIELGTEPLADVARFVRPPRPACRRGDPDTRSIWRTGGWIRRASLLV